MWQFQIQVDKSIITDHIRRMSTLNKVQKIITQSEHSDQSFIMVVYEKFF